MDVFIDNIRYVPAAEIKEPTDANLHALLRELVSMYYFNEQHKMRPHLYDAIRHVSPELADLMNDDPNAAYKRMNPEQN